MLPIRGTSAYAHTAEARTHAAEWDLVPRAAQLTGRPVLLLAGRRDVVVPPALHHEPLAAALRAQPSAQLTTEVLDSDHSFTERRITLARAVVTWLSTLPMAPTTDRGRP